MITSKDNELIKNTVKLVKSSKRRTESRLFTAEGVRLCRDGVESAFRPELFFFTTNAKEKYSGDYEKIASDSKKICEVSQQVFEKISDTKSPQGFFCVFNMLDKCKKPYKINNGGRYIALDNVRDPSNVGTVLRTCEALGFDGVIMSKNCCDFYSPKVVRGSMGAVFRLPVMIADDLAAYIRSLNDLGIQAYGSTPRDAQDITEVKFNGGVMIIGNEGSGISDEVLAACSKRVKIPMAGRAESLNAAAAAAILMWEFVKQ